MLRFTRLGLAVHACLVLATGCSEADECENQGLCQLDALRACEWVQPCPISRITEDDVRTGRECMMDAALAREPAYIEIQNWLVIDSQAIDHVFMLGGETAIWIDSFVGNDVGWAEENWDYTVSRCTLRSADYFETCRSEEDPELQFACLGPGSWFASCERFTGEPTCP